MSVRRKNTPSVPVPWKTLLTSPVSPGRGPGALSHNSGLQLYGWKWVSSLKDETFLTSLSLSLSGAFLQTSSAPTGPGTTSTTVGLRRRPSYFITVLHTVSTERVRVPVWCSQWRFRGTGRTKDCRLFPLEVRSQGPRRPFRVRLPWTVQGCPLSAVRIFAYSFSVSG